MAVSALYVSCMSHVSSPPPGMSLVYGLPGVQSIRADESFTRKHPPAALWKALRRQQNTTLCYASFQGLSSEEDLEQWFAYHLRPPTWYVKSPFYLSLGEESPMWLRVDIDQPTLYESSHAWLLALYHRMKPFRLLMVSEDLCGGLAFVQERDVCASHLLLPSRAYGLPENI